MRYSLLGLLWLVTFTAIGFAALSSRSRAIVAVLALATMLTILFGLLSAMLCKGDQRPFWIGFTVFALGYWFWLGGPNREFYTLPGVAAEWCAGGGIYSEFSYYDGVTSATPAGNNRYLAAVAGRLRYIANQVAAIYIGILGGFLGPLVARRSAGSGRAALD